MSRALIELHLTYLRAGGAAANSVEARMRLLYNVEKSLGTGLESATVEQLSEFMSCADWARATRAVYFKHMRQFYRWAVRARHISIDPTLDMDAPRTPTAVPHPVTDAELAEALAKSAGTYWQLAIILAAYAGLRVAEMARLERENVNAEHITVWNGKGGKTAKLPTHPEIWRLVEPMPSGLLLPSRCGSQIDLTTKARLHFDRIGMPDVHLHRFRHWYATALLTKGADIRTVQSLMRHATLQTTAGYLDLVDARRRDAVDLLQVPGGDRVRPSRAAVDAIEALTGLGADASIVGVLLAAYERDRPLSAADRALVILAFGGGR